MSAWLELPLVSPPPWMKTYTGRESCPRRPDGRQTLTNRQSSVSERGPLVLAAAGQVLPKRVASATPFQLAAGGRGRPPRSPTRRPAGPSPQKPPAPLPRGKPPTPPALGRADQPAPPPPPPA